MKTMKWGIGVAAIFAALMVIGCLKRDFDELKSMPIHDKQTDTIDRYTLGLHFNRGKTHNWQNTEVPNDINIILLDSAYKKVDYFYFLKFNSWFKKLKFENGIMPKSGPTFVHYLCLFLRVKILGHFPNNTDNFTLPRLK